MSDDWVMTTLGDVLCEVDERNVGGEAQLVLSVTEGRGIVPQTSIYKKRIATEDTSKYKLLEPLDIAWNPYLLWTGAVGQWLGDEPGVTSPVYPVFRVQDGQSARFWGLLLDSGRLTPYFDSRAIGSVQRRRRTTVPVFKAAPVLAPPLYIQCKIVEVIGALDGQIAALDAENGAISALRIAVLDELLARATAGEPRFPLGAIGKFDRGRRFTKSDYVDAGLGCIHYGQIYTEFGALATSPVTFVPEAWRSTMRLAHPGDLVIAATSENVEDVCKAVAWLGTEDVAVHDDCYIFRHELDPRFASYLFASSQFQRQKLAFVSETKVVRVSGTNLAKIEVSVPSRKEQERIVAVIGGLDLKIAAIGTETDHLRALRMSLLFALLNKDMHIGDAERALA